MRETLPRFLSNAHRIGCLLCAISAVAACGGPASSIDAGAREAGVGDAALPDAGPDAGPLRWRRLPEGPPPRWGHVAVYDRSRDRMLIATGSGVSGRLDDLWSLQLPGGTWERIEPVGARPSPRYTAAAIADEPRDRMLLFGGDDGSSGTDDVWALDLGSHVWTLLAPGPSRRFDAAVATDGRRVWVYAGFDSAFLPLDDLWELDLTTDTWRELPSVGVRPSPRTNLVMGYDPPTDRIVVFGGHGDAGSTPRWDTWAYDLASERWNELSPGLPPNAYAHHAYANDPGCRVVWLFGGDNNDAIDVNRVYGLRLSSPEAFVPLDATGAPPGRRHSSLVRDRRGDLIVFGGWMGSALLSDAWRLPVRCPDR